VKITPFDTTHHATDAAFVALKNFVVSATGLSYYSTRDAELDTKVKGRMTALALRDYWSYLALLQHPQRGDAELDQLIELLTIGETYFFRHTEVFDSLRRDILPELLRTQRRSNRLRIWSAGCATGAEAYSLSILLRHSMATEFRDWDISIIGTDINRQYLSKAREGRFESWAFRCTPTALKESCFLRDGSSWGIRPEFKEDVTFQYHNLVRHAFPSIVHNLYAFDIILCRNVMIYFSDAINQRIAGSLQESLIDGGWLIVGHAEYKPDLFGTLESVQTKGAVLYRRKARSAPAVAPVPRPAYSDNAPPRVAPPGAPAATTDVARKRTVRADAPATALSSTRRAIREEKELSRLRDLADRGQIEDAATRCGDMLERGATNKTCFLYHAMLAQQLGKLAVAERSLRHAIRIEPTYMLAYYYLGSILARQKKARDAEDAFQLVLRYLETCSHDQPIDDAEGITAAELRELTELQVTMLKELES
jgi:chemotaxis protein methyltransferase CheR